MEAQHLNPCFEVVVISKGYVKGKTLREQEVVAGMKLDCDYIILEGN